ncbi:MAG TPA: DUF1254 domain-containing protein [Bryobacteraceae bacterium]|jgi:hypothetical protein|nr:DUF1254 domain-containing protein [Bryobacteraceae bacterium]
MHFHARLAAFSIVVGFIAGLLPAQLPRAAPPSAGEIRAIAQRAYTFAYPLVLMEYTRRASLRAGAGMNRFAHAATFPDANFHRVVRPNADTLYSSAWLDLSKGPLILHVPDTHGRYYVVQFLDAWTDTFASIGKRTTGTAEGWYAIVGPTGWTGKLPAGSNRIEAPTNMVWLLGRTLTRGPADYDNVHAIQRGYTLTPLSSPVSPTTSPRISLDTPPPALVAQLETAGNRSDDTGKGESAMTVASLPCRECIFERGFGWMARTSISPMPLPRTTCNMFGSAASSEIGSGRSRGVL